MSHRALGKQFDELREDLDKNTTYSHRQWKRHSRGVTREGLVVTAEHPRFGEIGSMDLPVDPDDSGNREIYDINVVFKRKGVGTRLYNYAKEQGLNPVHSADRTDQGNAWAESVGDAVPPRSDRRYRNDGGYGA